ncbi:MAG: hypothetical protein CVV64_07820 [Candidatus Wallbacteria bacterium HGW-Wallbacteria-1]|jgi:hypothetical protein|uniref:MEDS domain-containing protein n=1 Tax=Candidatus Wallbacteria bacterium HGW-Wallbacteria-1 TaxID=2013854 RepID=A0A2N1PR09_9BACT|nr:MAG: hypothetical protein CVV64_07820 [Candidatus Wallbacteria bacterium HGW-Wallbacteria-1]
MELRNIGETIGSNLDMGIHICHLYKSTDELLVPLADFFAGANGAGQKFAFAFNGELDNINLIGAISGTNPMLFQAIQDGSAVPISFDSISDDSGNMDTLKTINMICDMERESLAAGYAGLRIAGNIAINGSDWDNVMAFESRLNSLVSNLEVSAMCAYSLQQCGPSRIVDAVSTHHGTIVDRDGSTNMVTRSGNPERDRINVTLEKMAGLLGGCSHSKSLNGISSREYRASRDEYIPICSYCKSMRSTDIWLSTEDYVASRWRTDFTHSICPECLEKVYDRIRKFKIQEA